MLDVTAECPNLLRVCPALPAMRPSSHCHRQCRSSSCLVASQVTATKQHSHWVSRHDLFVYFHTQLWRAIFLYALTPFNWLGVPGLFLEFLNWSFDPQVYY